MFDIICWAAESFHSIPLLRNSTIQSTWMGASLAVPADSLFVITVDIVLQLQEVGDFEAQNCLPQQNPARA